MDIKVYQRERRKIDLVRRLKIICSLSTLFLLAIWGFFWLPVLRISIINSDDFAPKSEIESAVAPYLASLNALWLPNNNFFLFKNTEIESILKSKGIGIAVAKKNFPKTVDIKFPQTDPWLIYCGQNDCFYVSEKGVLNERAPKFSPNPLPEITLSDSGKKIGDIVATSEQISSLRIIFQKLGNLNISVSSFSFGGNNEIKIITAENWYLLIRDEGAISKTIADLGLLLSEKIKDARSKLEYIDMRFPNKAFYKLRPAT